MDMLTYWPNYVLIVVAILAIATVAKTFFTVDQQWVAIIERFGKFRRSAEAGLHVKFPWIDKIHDLKSLRTVEIRIVVETKTKDNVFVKVMVALQYRVSDAFKATYSLENEEEQLGAFVQDTLRGRVPSMPLDELFEQQHDLAEHMHNELQPRFDGFGFSLERTLIPEISPDGKVVHAMNEINAQERLRIAATAKAEADKIVTVKHAEAEAESKKLQGEGVAAQRQAIVRGFRESVEDLAKATGTTPAEVTRYVLMTQYFDTLAALGGDSRSKVVFVTASPAGLGAVEGELSRALMVAGEARADERDPNQPSLLDGMGT